MNRGDMIRNGITISLGLAVAYYFLLGPYSVHQYIKSKMVIAHKKERIAQLTHEIDTLQTATTAWAQNPSSAQTIARHDLGMGYTNEVVYLVKS